MSVYWLRPFKVCVDFTADEYWKVSRCPPVPVIAIDLLSCEPDCTATRMEEMTRHYLPCVTLHLSAWDTITLVAVLHAEGWLKPSGQSARFYRAFVSNPDNGLRSVVRTGLDLRAPGMAAVYKRIQLSSTPQAWRELHQADRKTKFPPV